MPNKSKRPRPDAPAIERFVAAGRAAQAAVDELVTPRRGRPRSPEGRVTLNITVPPRVAAWLKAHGNASARITELAEGEMVREKQAARDERESARAVDYLRGSRGARS